MSNRIHDDDPRTAQDSAVQINKLVVDLWITIERNGPRYDEFELTSQQHAVLGLIATRPRMTPRALSNALAVTKGAISQHLGFLEREGYICRQRCDRDRRVQVLCLDKRGLEYHATLRRFERYAADRYLDKLSAGELTEIVTALKKLKAAFDE